MITVHGYLGRPSAVVAEACRGADLVVASARALDALDVPAGKQVVLGKVSAAIDRLLAHEAAPHAGPVVVLASGDPLLFGVVRALRAAGLRCRVAPGVSSVAAAFAAVAVPWDDAQVVSAHGFPLRGAVAACRALPKVAVLTAPGRGVRELARALPDVERWYVVAERLGEPDERVRVVDGPAARGLPDVAEPNVVLVLAAPPADPRAVGTPTAYLGGARPSPAEANPAESFEPSQRVKLPAAGSVEVVAKAVDLALGRHLPVLGDVVWAAGGLAPRVRAACARTGAALVDLTDRPPPAVADGPDLLLTDDTVPATHLATLQAARPRVTVHVSLSGPGWSPDLAGEVDVEREQVPLAAGEGQRTALLTTVRRAEPAAAQTPDAEPASADDTSGARASDDRDGTRPGESPLVGQVVGSSPAARRRAREIDTVLGGTRIYEGPAAKNLPAAWRECDLLVSHLALGATTRIIAPLLADKTRDPAVVVVDEAGRYVVPVVGGHAGGGNDLARRIAAGLGATAVVTTATDSLGLPALDTLGWPYRGDVARVTRALLDGRPVRLVRECRCPLPPLPDNVAEAQPGAGDQALGAPAAQVVVTDRGADAVLGAADVPTVVLHPPTLVVGLGCNYGTSKDSLEALLRATLADAGLALESVTALTTIDRKAGELGLVQLAAALRVPLVDYPAERLAAQDVPTPSAVVEATVGSPSVAEASVLARGAALVVPKRKTPEATCAVGRLPARGRLTVVGLGPGSRDLLAPMAVAAIQSAAHVVGYGPYVRQIRDLVRPGASVLASKMGTEEERIAHAIARAREGASVAVVCSGDPAVYAMASPVLERGTDGVDVVVVPGVTAGLAASSLLGAPLGHDHATISLSDLHTPWDVIERRLAAAAAGDLVTVLYNPRSKTRRHHLPRALEILGEHRAPGTPVAVVRDAYRRRQSVTMTTLDAFDPGLVDMNSLVVVGSSTTRYVTSGGGEQRMVTPRDYTWMASPSEGTPR